MSWATWVWCAVAMFAVLVSYPWANAVPVTKHNIVITLTLWAIALVAMFLATLSSL